MIARLQNEPAEPELLACAAPFVKSQLDYLPTNDTERRLYKTLSDLFFQRFSELSEADQRKSVEVLQTLMGKKSETETEAQAQTEPGIQ